MFWRAFKIVILVIVIILVLPWIILLAASPFNARTPSPTDLSKSALMAAPPKPLAKEITLKVVTFNIHDMYLISRDRPERMRGIGQALVDLDPDLAGIQEAWVEQDRNTLIEAAAGSRLKYHKYYPSGTVGSGLLILSAYPIVEPFFHRYEKNGKWYKPYHGDWWGGKGLALARVQLPNDAGFIDFYDTHAHASYGSDEYDGDRETQMHELAAFIKASATGTSPALAVGDFNTRTGTKAFGIAVEEGGLEWMMTGSPRIDNIFAVKNPHYTFEVLDMAPIDRKIAIGRRETHLSDHSGYISTIRIKPVIAPQG
jgi:endonuclease/exonuclease/phosphatase family metal-dependent hydrolase